SSAADFGSRLLERQRRTVRTVGRHGVPGVRETDDAGLDGDRVSGQPVGISGSVPTLVMVTNERHRVAEAAELRDDVGAVARMALDHVVLGGRQCPRLSEDGVRHADLADVVDQAPVTEGFATLIRYPELVCHGERDAL